MAKKRNVSTAVEPNTEQPSQQPTTQAKKAKPILQVHDSQYNLTRRVLEALCMHKKACLEAPTGSGKTIMARGIMDLSKDDGVKTLTIFVGASATQADKHAEVIDSFLSSAFLLKRDADKVNLKLLDESVRITMTESMFKQVAIPASAFPFRTDAIERVDLFLDEVHNYCTPKLSTMVQSLVFHLQQSNIKVRVIGMTATLPDFSKRGKQKHWARLVGDEPPVEFTPGEMTAFNSDMRIQPKLPDWEVVELPAPDLTKSEVEDLKALLIGRMLPTAGASDKGDDPLQAYMAKHNMMGKIIARQAHGKDGDHILAALSEDGVDMQKVGEDGSLPNVFDPHFESCLIANASGAGAQEQLELLKELNERRRAGEEGLRVFKLHDMRSTEKVASKKELEAYMKHAKANTRLTIGVIGKEKGESHDEYGKNVSAIIAIGVWEQEELVQLGGRLGRAFKGQLEHTDFVPKEFKLVHISSPYAETVVNISDIDVPRTTRSSPYTFPKEVQTQLDKAADIFDAKDHLRVEENAKILVEAEKKLGLSALATKYVELEMDSTELSTFLVKEYTPARNKWAKYKAK